MLCSKQGCAPSLASLPHSLQQNPAQASQLSPLQNKTGRRLLPACKTVSTQRRLRTLLIYGFSRVVAIAPKIQSLADWCTAQFDARPRAWLHLRLLHRASSASVRFLGLWGPHLVLSADTQQALPVFCSSPFVKRCRLCQEQRNNQYDFGCVRTPTTRNGSSLLR